MIKWTIHGKEINGGVCVFGEWGLKTFSESETITKWMCLTATCIWQMCADYIAVTAALGKKIAYIEEQFLQLFLS